MANGTPDHEVPPAVVGNFTENLDRRRVFVVHGRNMAARDALFSFLQAIDLAPIEWEEAIAMTESGAPFIGEALDRGFSQSQAAVILFTGDDMARVGTRYLSAHDSGDERTLKPQARANVLFEAGMAYGKFPKRTILVGVGPSRDFSDVAGRHIVRLSNKPESRMALANRLRNAGCRVRTDGRAGYLTAGDFDAAIQEPDTHSPSLKLRALRREANFNQEARHKNKIWIYILNEGSEAIKIRPVGWDGGEEGIRGRALSGIMQLQIGSYWVPETQSVNELHVPPGAEFRIWIDPDGSYSLDDLKKKCQSNHDIGKIKLFIDGSVVFLPV